jgi:tetratricopeptide (TPR) repeat protein
MKIPSKELIDLIATLNVAEKRQFVGVYGKEKKENIPEYILLFSSYIKYPNYSDEQIKKLCGIKNFARVKHYLQKQLLNFISEQENLSSEKEVMNMIVVGRALSDRSLLEQAIKLLNKARRFAFKRQLYKYVLILDDLLHELESRVGSQNHFDYFISEKKKNDFDELINSIKQEQEANEFLLKRRLFSMENNALMRSEDSAKELDRIFKQYVTIDENEIISFDAKGKYYIVAAYYYQQHNKLGEAIAYFEKCAQLFDEENPNPSENFNSYVVVLHNLMFTYSRLGDFVKVREVLDRLHTIKPRTKLHKKGIMQSYITYESMYCKFYPQYNLRKKKLRDAETYLLANEKDMQQQLYLSSVFHLSVNYFIDCNFKKALEIINLLDKLESQPYLKDYISVAKIYRLIIYFEMGKTDLLAFSIRNTYRFILKNMLMYKFEKEVIGALKKIINTANRVEQNRIWQETYSKLRNLQTDTNLYQVFALFNFSNWIYCRLKKLEYAKLMIG